MAMKILFVSLGCDKNRVDAEKMLGLLSGQGWQLTDDELEADVIVINTCCFINEAKEESIRNILEYARCKEEGHCRALICTGCMAQRYAEEIREELPEVDAVVGTTAYDRIAEVIQEALRGERSQVMDDLSRLALPQGERVLTTGGHYAYLKIAEGCDKHCTYCAIPSMRGPYRSVPREILIREAEDLASKGVKELILVAQETTLYGTDLYGRRCLHELIRDLAQIRGIFWIRVLYCYPEEIYEDLIRCMKTEKKFLHYLDLPIQHANDEILRRMGRRTTREDYKYYDYLIGMDHANVYNMKRIYGGDPDGKISMLLDYCGRSGQEVADPWYTDDFDATWDDVLQGCTALLRTLTRQK